MIQISIIQKESALAKFFDLMKSKNLPGVTNAILEAGNYVQAEWSKTISSSSAKEGWKAGYQKALGQRVIKGTNSKEFGVEIFAIRTQSVNFIEDGIKRFDMKPGLLNGPKARTNKKGEKYNIVSFRHGTPTSKKAPMPVSVYAKAKKLAKYDIEKRYKVKGIKPEGGKDYTSPDKLQAGLTKKLKKRHKTDPYAGMVKTGGTGQTQYRTFRIITKNSKGWMFPGVPAVKIYDMVGDKIKGPVKKILQDGLMKDLDAGMKFLKGKGI